MAPTFKPTLQLRKAPAYASDLISRIRSAKRRIVIVAMVLGPGEPVEAILKEVERAAHRGVQVTIVGDRYSRLQVIRAGLSRRPRFRNPKNDALLFDRLQSAGARVVWVGKLGINPFKGRMHAKFTVVDNTVFTFGGVNFYGGAFTHADYMLRATNSSLANYLEDLVEEVSSGRPSLDKAFRLNSLNKVLFDGGHPGQSIIYQTACRLAARARKVYYVSQMSPSGELARILRQTDNVCYFNRARRAPPPTNLSIAFDSRRFGMLNRYKKRNYIHAKFMVFEDAQGRLQAITGSNNFSWRGVAYGTKEIALHTSDQALCRQLLDFMKSEVV